MWVPVLIMSGFGRGAVDAREEGGLGQIHLFGVQTKRLGYHLLNSATNIPGFKTEHMEILYIVAIG